MFLLIALAGHEERRVTAEVPLRVQVDAVDVDTLTLAHLEQRIVALGRAHLVERIARRAGEAERVPEIRTTDRGVVERGDRIRPVLHFLELQHHGQVFGGVPLRLDATIEDVIAARALARAAAGLAGDAGDGERRGGAAEEVGGVDRPIGRAELVVAVGLRDGADQADREDVLDDGHIERTLHAGRVEAAVTEAQLRAEVLHVRTLAADVDRAARRVLAEQRALRTAEHFDALDVEGVEQLGLHARHDEVIDLNADRRVLVDDDVGEAHTAHRERRGVERRDASGGEAGDRGGESRDVFGDHAVDVVRGDGRDRHRGPLQVRLARTPGGGDGHLFQLRFLRGSRLSCG